MLENQVQAEVREEVFAVVVLVSPIYFLPCEQNPIGDLNEVGVEEKTAHRLFGSLMKKMRTVTLYKRTDM